MIPYAGKYPRGKMDQRYCPGVSSSYRALMMFRAGKDTAFIADHFKLTEAGVLRWITEERSRERGLPNPYFSAAE